MGLSCLLSVSASAASVDFIDDLRATSLPQRTPLASRRFFLHLNTPPRLSPASSFYAFVCQFLYTRNKFLKFILNLLWLFIISSTEKM